MSCCTTSRALSRPTRSLICCSCEKEIPAGKTPVQIFGNHAVFDTELTRLFARTWNFVGHVSEIPMPGRLRDAQDRLDPVIVVRGDDKAASTLELLPPLRHRTVPGRPGQRDQFQCHYHRWIYKNTGEWQSASPTVRGYREFDPEESGMFKAAHVGDIAHNPWARTMDGAYGLQSCADVIGLRPPAYSASTLWASALNADEAVTAAGRSSVSSGS